MVLEKKLPCFILARGGSKSLRKKNLHNFLNRPLMEHTINYAKKSKYITHIVVSTDSKDIYNFCKKKNCFVVYPRPKNLSNDKAKSLPALIHAAKEFEKKIGNFDIFAFLQATEPLRPKNILNDCIKLLLNNKKLNSAFAGYEYKKNFWIKRRNKFKRISPVKNAGVPRQSAKKNIIYREDCGVSLASRKRVLLRNKKLFKEPLQILSYNSKHGFLDIHNKSDIYFGEMLARYLK